MLGILAVNQDGDYARGEALWEESLTLARRAGDANLEGTTLCNLGYAALMRRDYERAVALCKEALTLAYKLGSATVEIVPETLINLGLSARGQGHHNRALASFKEALMLSREAGIDPSTINALEGMAGVAGALRKDHRTARLWGAAQAAREATRIALPPADRELHEPYLGAARQGLGKAGWESALGEGRAMSLEEAAEYALSDEYSAPPKAPAPQDAPSGGPMGELTRREREVALLVARGLTNRQISVELSISGRTAGNHVARILRKLGLRSRVQIASLAAEHLSPRPEADQ